MDLRSPYKVWIGQDQRDVALAIRNAPVALPLCAQSPAFRVENLGDDLRSERPVETVVVDHKDSFDGCGSKVYVPLYIQLACA